MAEAHGQQIEQGPPQGTAQGRRAVEDPQKSVGDHLPHDAVNRSSARASAARHSLRIEMAVLCPTCRSENLADGRFCTACGSQLVLACVPVASPIRRWRVFAAAAARPWPRPRRSRRRRSTRVQRRAGEASAGGSRCCSRTSRARPLPSKVSIPRRRSARIDPALQIPWRGWSIATRACARRRLGDGILAVWCAGGARGPCSTCLLRSPRHPA